MNLKVLLQSSGLVSTAMAILLLDGQQDMVQPIFINYGGKSHKEWKIFSEKIWPLLHHRFPTTYLYPIVLTMKKESKEHRNRQMIKTVLDAYPNFDTIYTGLLDEGNRYPWDSNPYTLAKELGVVALGAIWSSKVALLQSFKTRDEPFFEQVLRLTDSCQLWFKRPCGQCFSCVERFNAFYKVYGDKPSQFNVVFPKHLKEKLGL